MNLLCTGFPVLFLFLFTMAGIGLVYKMLRDEFEEDFKDDDDDE